MIYTPTTGSLIFMSCDRKTSYFRGRMHSRHRQWWSQGHKCQGQGQGQGRDQGQGLDRQENGQGHKNRVSE